MSKQFVELVAVETAIQSTEELAQRHAALARCTETKKAIAAALRTQIQALQDQAEAQIADLNAQVAQHYSAIHAYVAVNRPSLLHKPEQKSFATATGRIGWQKERDTVRLTDDEEAVIERLRKHLGENAELFIETKESVRLQELSKNYHLVEDIKGIEAVEGKDKFYVGVTDLKLEVKPTTHSERLVTK